MDANRTSRAYWRRAVRALAVLPWLLTSCGGSSPEPQTPGQETRAPQEPAPEALTSDQANEEDAAGAAQKERADGSLSAPSGAAEPSSAQPSRQQAPVSPGAPPPAPAREVEGAGDDEKSRDKRSKADELIGTGVSGNYSLPKALAALEHFDARLSETIAASAPDCDLAETFRRSVCELAERICTLEGDLPSSGSERHCGDSRARCSAASSRFRRACTP